MITEKPFQCSVVLDITSPHGQLFFMSSWLSFCIRSFLFLEYLEVFEFFGQDKNGKISTKQLSQAMRMVGLNPTDHQIQAIINEKEYDGEFNSQLLNLMTVCFDGNIILDTVPLQCLHSIKTERQMSHRINITLWV